MPNITAPALGLPAKAFSGGSVGTPSGVAGEFMVSQLLGAYGTLVKTGKVQTAYATLAAASPVAFNVTNGVLLGGPVIWNKLGNNVEAHILAMGVTISTANTTGPTSFGLTGYGGVTVLPTSTTAIDFSGNAYIGGSASQMTLFRTMTPPAAQQTAGFFLPLMTVGTTALTAMFTPTYVDIGGAVVVPPGAFVAVASGLVPTAQVASVALIWAELPV